MSFLETKRNHQKNTQASETTAPNTELSLSHNQNTNDIDSSSIVDLNKDVLVSIFMYCGVESLSHLSIVYENANMFASLSEAWRERLHQHFPQRYSQLTRNPEAKAGLNYQALFRESFDSVYNIGALKASNPILASWEATGRNGVNASKERLRRRAEVCKKFAKDMKQLFTAVKDKDVERMHEMEFSLHDAFNHDGHNTLMACAASGYLQSVLDAFYYKALIACRTQLATRPFDEDQARGTIYIETTLGGPYNSTLLYWASALNQAESVKELIVGRRSAYVNRVCSNNGETPLFVAAKHGHTAVVAILLSNAAVNINLPNKFGQTPLFIATKFGHEAVVKLLLTHEAVSIDQVSNDSETPFYVATVEGRLEIVKILLQAGANIEYKSVYGDAPVYKAIENGHSGVAHYLLDYGAHIDKTYNDGRTPLYVAAQVGLLSMVKHLAINTENVDLPSYEELTPLAIAAANGHLEVVRYLFTSGASVERLTEYGNSPLYMAAQAGNLNVVKFLVENGASVDQVNLYKETPIFIAAHNGHFDVVTYLFECGATVKQANNCGTLASDAARLQGHYDLALYLNQEDAWRDAAQSNNGSSQLRMYIMSMYPQTMSNSAQVKQCLAEHKDDTSLFSALKAISVKNHSDGLLTLMLSFLQEKKPRLAFIQQAEEKLTQIDDEISSADGQLESKLTLALYRVPSFEPALTASFIHANNDVTQVQRVGISPLWCLAPVVGAVVGGGSVAIVIKFAGASAIVGSNPVALVIGLAALAGFILGLIVLGVVKYRNDRGCHSLFCCKSNNEAISEAKLPLLLRS